MHMHTVTPIMCVCAGEGVGICLIRVARRGQLRHTRLVREIRHCRAVSQQTHWPENNHSVPSLHPSNINPHVTPEHRIPGSFPGSRRRCGTRSARRARTQTRAGAPSRARRTSPGPSPPRAAAHTSCRRKEGSSTLCGKMREKGVGERKRERQRFERPCMQKQAHASNARGWSAHSQVHVLVGPASSNRVRCTC